jgi:hypothetical protein
MYTWWYSAWSISVLLLLMLVKVRLLADTQTFSVSLFFSMFVTNKKKSYSLTRDHAGAVLQSVLCSSLIPVTIQLGAAGARPKNDPRRDTIEGYSLT